MRRYFCSVHKCNLTRILLLNYITLANTTSLDLWSFKIKIYSAELLIKELCSQVIRSSRYLCLTRESSPLFPVRVTSAQRTHKTNLLCALTVFFSHTSWLVSLAPGKKKIKKIRECKHTWHTWCREQKFLKAFCCFIMSQTHHNMFKEENLQ